MIANDSSATCVIRVDCQSNEFAFLKQPIFSYSLTLFCLVRTSSKWNLATQCNKRFLITFRWCIYFSFDALYDEQKLPVPSSLQTVANDSSTLFCAPHLTQPTQIQRDLSPPLLSESETHIKSSVASPPLDTEATQVDSIEPTQALQATPVWQVHRQAQQPEKLDAEATQISIETFTPTLLQVVQNHEEEMTLALISSTMAPTLIDV